MRIGIRNCSEMSSFTGIQGRRILEEPISGHNDFASHFDVQVITGLKR